MCLRMSDSIQGVQVPADAREHGIQSRVFQIVAERANVDAGQITRDTQLYELGDSLDVMETLMQLEEEFELSIRDEEIEGIKTVGQLLDLIDQKVAARKSGHATAP